MRNLRLIIAFSIFLLVVSACGASGSTQPGQNEIQNQQNDTSTSGAQNDFAQPENSTQTQSSPADGGQNEQSEAIDMSRVAPHAPLSQSGPWYVTSNPEGLYAFNMDGSGLTFLGDAKPGQLQTLSQGVSTSGGRFAFMTWGSDYEDILLHVIEMANPSANKIIPLLSDNQADLDAKRALVEEPSYAWSHDGQKLAFFGVLEGPSSDLYVYDTTDGSIERLTTGPSQGYQPVWSPDDRYIAHTSAETFGTGAGYMMSGVWAASADGSEVITLPMPDRTSGEIILGWRDNDTVLSYSWSPDYGNYNLRYTNLHAGLAQEIWEYPFSQVGFLNIDAPWVILGVDEYLADQNPAGLWGIFTMKAPDYQPQLQLEENPGYFQPTGYDSFMVNFGDFYNYLLGPNTRKADAGTVISSLQGYAWYHAGGLYLGTEGYMGRSITTAPVELAVWGADGGSIMFSDGDHLFVTTAPDWEPVLVAAIFFPEEIVLVNP